MADDSPNHNVLARPSKGLKPGAVVGHDPKGRGRKGLKK